MKTKSKHISDMSTQELRSAAKILKVKIPKERAKLAKAVVEANIDKQIEEFLDKKKDIQYKQLPTSFKGRASQKSFSFTQIKREGDIAIFEKKDSTTSYWEVIIVQKHNGRTMPGNIVVEPSEFYPGDNQFGIQGWCFGDLEKAEEKFNELIKEK